MSLRSTVQLLINLLNMQAQKLFLFLLLGLSLTFSTANAQKWNKRTISGQGELVKQSLSVSDFHSVGLGLNGTIYLKQADKFEIEIEAQKNIIDNLNREVKNGSWSINLEDNKSARNYKRVTVWISMPTIKNLSIGGSGDIIGKTAFNDLGDLKLNIGGSGSVEMGGDAESVTISIAGSGKVKCGDMQADKAKVNIAGSGNAYIDLGEEGDLNVSIAGSGSVFYKGRPRVKSSIAGSGKIESM